MPPPDGGPSGTKPDALEAANVSPEQKVEKSQTYLGILGELDINANQWQRRERLIEKLEEALTERYQAPNRVLAYVFRLGHPRAQINSADISSLEQTLTSVSGAEQINLILHSQGGDGTIVEKIVAMCRAHCSGERRKFRVVVPNIAKSAATLITLGADKIIMGYCSELGPIDPQIPVTVSGIFQSVSAQSFVDARDNLLDAILKATSKKKPTVGYLQQLAGLNIPFTVECSNWINFSKKTAVALLSRYMLRERIPQAKQRKREAEEIAEKLLSKKLFPVHGQFIDGRTARDELHLEVELLDREDPIWTLIWEYYCRCEIQMNIPVPQLPNMVKIKLFESRQVSLVTPDVPG